MDAEVVPTRNYKKYRHSLQDYRLSQCKSRVAKNADKGVHVGLEPTTSAGISNPPKGIGTAALIPTELMNPWDTGGRSVHLHNTHQLTVNARGLAPLASACATPAYYAATRTFTGPSRPCPVRDRTASHAVTWKGEGTTLVATTGAGSSPAMILLVKPRPPRGRLAHRVSRLGV